MSYTPYIIEGNLKEEIQAYFDERGDIMDRRKEYSQSIGADNKCVVCKGPYVKGFIFENKEDKPDRWVWAKSPIWSDDLNKQEYAKPQKRSKADKIEWENLAMLTDTTSEKLKKLFYGDTWGFRDGNKLLSVGIFFADDKCYAEVATKSTPLKGMKEILRSEYNLAKEKA